MEMPPNYVHVVQLRLTSEEWRLLAEMAKLRRVSVEDLLREGLRLPQREPQTLSSERPPHLRLVGSGAPAAWRRSRRRR
ncbi:MAG TPA: hypothetical protein VGY13_09375 [Solirubrobacteraceae bacterium]|nr:hypothetical protein [Solirubrobacteraceae bacterium]